MVPPLLKGIHPGHTPRKTEREDLHARSRPDAVASVSYEICPALHPSMGQYNLSGMICGGGRAKCHIASRNSGTNLANFGNIAGISIPSVMTFDTWIIFEVRGNLSSFEVDIRRFA